ncbi:MAG: Uma2 family endonuclease [Bacteroidota bacterium]
MEVREPPATYTDYAALPETGPRYEIMGGMGTLSPAPDSKHQCISANLTAILHRHISPARLGLVFAAPCDVVLSETDVIQPDLLFVTEARKSIVKGRGIFGAPDLVVEILSPATRQRDTTEKYKLYARYGVREYWVIDPGDFTVVLWTSAGRPLDRRAVFAGGGEMESEVLPGLAVRLAEIFAGVEEIGEE